MSNTDVTDGVHAPFDAELAQSPSRNRMFGGNPLIFKDAGLEQRFTRHLLESTHNCAVLSGTIGMAVWLLFIVVDALRYHSASPGHYGSAFFYYVLLPRAAGLLVLLYAILSFRSRKNSDSKSIAIIFGTIFVIGVGITSTTCFYQNANIAAAQSAHLLIIVAAFSPVGLRFSQSMALSFALLGMSIVLGMVILLPEQWKAHYILMGMEAVAIVLAATGAYARESSMRQQFLLTHLMEWKANHDALTGLYNRHKLADSATQYLLQAQRDGLPVAFAVIDIDHFKAYNDCYGHQQGDAAIQAVGALLQGHARKPLDMAIRLGGEEFAIFTYGEDAPSLARRLGSFQEEIEARAIVHARSSTSTHLTVSIGVASSNKERDNFEEMYKRADEALYHSKGAGRNRITVAS